MSTFSATNLCRRRARPSRPTSSLTKLAKQLFWSGSPRNEICATSKQWNNNTLPITTPLSPNLKQSSAPISIFFPQQRQRNENELDNTEISCARGAAHHSRVLKIEQPDKAAGRRLLHLHHAPVGACGSARQMSDLR